MSRASTPYGGGNEKTWMAWDKPGHDEKEKA
jgi:hypothetical protein